MVKVVEVLFRTNWKRIAILVCHNTEKHRNLLIDHISTIFLVRVVIWETNVSIYICISQYWMNHRLVSSYAGQSMCQTAVRKSNCINGSGNLFYQVLLHDKIVKILTSELFASLLLRTVLRNTKFSNILISYCLSARAWQLPILSSCMEAQILVFARPNPYITHRKYL